MYDAWTEVIANHCCKGDTTSQQRGQYLASWWLVTLKPI